MAHRAGKFSKLPDVFPNKMFPASHVVDKRISDDAFKLANVQVGEGPQSRRFIEVRQTTPPHWSQRVKPTHFVSLPVAPTAPLVKTVAAFHNQVELMDEQWKAMLVPQNKLHLTVCVMSLSSPEEQLPLVAKAVQHFAETNAPFRMHFTRLGTFGKNRVLFAQPASNGDANRLSKSVKAFRMLMHDVGVDVKGNPHDDYVPHVTLAKVTREVKANLGIAELPPKMYAIATHDDMGTSTFSDVSVCNFREVDDEGVWKVECRERFAA